MKADHFPDDTLVVIFLPKGHNLQDLIVADKKIFSCFPNISLCTICDPRGGAM